MHMFKATEVGNKLLLSGHVLVSVTVLELVELFINQPPGIRLSSIDGTKAWPTLPA